MKQLTISISKIFDEFEKEQCRYSKRDFIDWDNYQKLKQQIMQKFNEIRKDALEDGSLGLIKKSDLDFLKQERQKTIEMIDKEKDIVKVCCLGLVHPDQTNQEEFTKWLQDTVIFHLEDLKRRVEKI